MHSLTLFLSTYYTPAFPYPLCTFYTPTSPTLSLHSTLLHPRTVLLHSTLVHSPTLQTHIVFLNSSLQPYPTLSLHCYPLSTRYTTTLSYPLSRLYTPTLSLYFCSLLPSSAFYINANYNPILPPSRLYTLLSHNRSRIYTLVLCCPLDSTLKTSSHGSPSLSTLHCNCKSLNSLDSVVLTSFLSYSLTLSRFIYSVTISP